MHYNKSVVMYFVLILMEAIFLMIKSIPETQVTRTREQGHTRGRNKVQMPYHHSTDQVTFEIASYNSASTRYIPQQKPVNCTMCLFVSMTIQAT